MSLLFERLLRVMRGAGIEPDFRQIEEIIWLSSRLPGGKSSTPEGRSIQQQAEEQPEQRQNVPSGKPSSPRQPERRTTSSQVSSAASVYSNITSTDGGVKSRRVRVPGAQALPQALEVNRALRPLLRRITSKRAVELDEDETVHQSAESGILTPVSRPRKERWLEAAVVVEDKASMEIWEEVIRQFQRLLEHHGAFRNVRRWRLSFTENGARIISLSGTPQDYRTINDPTGRCLVILFTDGVSPVWRDGTAARVLSDWGEIMPVVATQVLSERLWHLTQIGKPTARVTALRPGPANKELNVAPAWWDETPLKGRLVLPIITLDPEPITQWARMLTGTGSFTAALVPITPPANDPAPSLAVDELSPEERIERFRHLCSETAYRLAIYLSTVPLQLPVMRLVQRVMLPSARIEHLSEVVLGGIIKRLPSAAASRREDEINFDFYEGVRELLHREIRRTELFRMLDEISRFITDRIGQACDFRALIADASGELFIPDAALPFAHLFQQALARFGINPQAPDSIVPMPDYEPGETAGPEIGDEQVSEDDTTDETPALHQIPKPPPDFTGRAIELAYLMSRLRHGSSAIAGIQGPSGAGKTVLALKLAELLSTEYPDAQLYLDLRGESQQPLTPAEAMSQIIYAYGETQRLPDDESELRAFYHSVLNGQRAILLMDNAGDQAQVEPLIPPATCLLLFTSRRIFTLAGMVGMNLDTLPLEDAQAFLLGIAPHIGSERAREIAELCGHLPLALRIVGSALAERSDRDAAEVVNSLKQALEQSGAVEAAIKVGYEMLATEQQSLLQALAVFPDTFTVNDAAAVSGMDDQAARVALNNLASYGLLEEDRAKGRYWLHDSVASYIASLTGSGTRSEEAYQRHSTYYCSLLKNLNSLYLEGSSSIFEALAAFDLEWENIKAGQAWASRAAPSNRDAALLCIDYPLVGEHLLDLRQPARNRIAWLETALESARRVSDPDKETHILSNLAYAYTTIGDIKRAIDIYEQALEHARRIDNVRAEGYLLNNLGSSYVDIGSPQRAMELFDRSLTIARQLEDLRSEGQVLSNLGRASLDLGEIERAVSYFERHLAIARQIGDLRGQSHALGNLGIACIESGNHLEAIELYREQLDIARQIGDRRGEGHALANLGLAYRQVENLTGSIEYTEAAVAIFEEMGSPIASDLRRRLSEMRAASPPPDESQALDFYDCFIIYSYADQTFARRLYDALQSRGIRCWMDDHQLTPGQAIYREVDRGVRLWDKVILCCSRDSLSSSWVNKEVSTAFEKEEALSKERGVREMTLVPLDLDGFMFSNDWQSVWKREILSRPAIDFRGWMTYRISFERQVNYLVQTLRKDSGNQIKALALKYEKLREDMPSGKDRTREMGKIFAEMKSLVPSISHLLAELANSESPGQRLAAIAILEVESNPDYVDWLSQRLEVEKPFVGYHAALALLSAVDQLEVRYYEKIMKAINIAKDTLGIGLKGADRYRTLDEALSRLRQNWTSYYFNPAGDIRSIGRSLKNGDYAELVEQLRTREVLIGVFENEHSALVATYVNTSARMIEIEGLYRPVEYYAVDIDEANRGMKPPIPTGTVK